MGTTMKNRYPGICDKCRKKVLAGGGGIAIKRQGAWFTRHDKCDEEQRESDEDRKLRIALYPRKDESNHQVVDRRDMPQRPLPFDRG